MGLLLSLRLSSGEYLTLGDFFRKRYSPRIEKVAIIVIWAAAQMRTLGQVLAATSVLSLESAVPIAATSVIVYTFIGGLLGDVVTNLVQGVFFRLPPLCLTMC